MSTAAKPYYSEAEYLARERLAPYKSEYFGGELHPMHGATREHNLLVTNLICSLKNQLAKEHWEVYPSNMRLRLPTGSYTYPDVSVVSGEPKFLDDEFDTLLNPTVLVEVLSQSSESYDRGAKTQQYGNLESLAHFVLVASEKLHIDVHTRQANAQWLISESSEMAAAVELPAIGCRLWLAEIYEKVRLPKQEARRDADGLSPKQKP